MKSVKADLNLNVVSSYDQTKTTIRGRVAQRTINSHSVLGPPLNTYVDVFNDTGALTTPAWSYFSTYGRIFSLNTPSAGIAYITLHNFDLTTGTKTYIGNIRISLPNTAATTQTVRSIKVLDNAGTTGWKIFITTVGSVTINGGTFMVNKIDQADFLSSGFTAISAATGNDQKAIYFLQDPSNIGVGQLQIASVGSLLDITNNKLFVHNGVSATHQYYVYDTSVAPTYSTNSVTGNQATDIITDIGHTFAANTPLVFTTLTGGAGLTANTVYFAVNVIAGTSYQLSATSGGAAINFTTDITSATIGRAFGTTGSNFLYKTGNLPALTGAVLVADSEDYALPGHTVNSGSPCVFFGTASNLYLGKLSELTSGATSWPSLITVNLLGTVNQITSPTAVAVAWSNFLDRALYLTNSNIFITKTFTNSAIELIFGGTNNQYRAGFVSNIIEMQLVSVSAIDIANGWLIVTGATAGQQGHFVCDLKSNYTYDYSYIITKVMDSPSSIYNFLATVEELFVYTGSLYVEYRTSGFGSMTGGWVALPIAEDISSFASGDQIQFKIRFDTLGFDTSIHAQVREFYLTYTSLSEISDNWEFSDDWSDNTTPSRVAFRLKKTYTSSVPTLYFRAYNLSNALLINNNTVTNAGNFEYSTDNGTTWNPLGTIPNTVGTLIRYSFTTPPGIDIRPGLRED